MATARVTLIGFLVAGCAVSTIPLTAYAQESPRLPDSYLGHYRDGRIPLVEDVVFGSQDDENPAALYRPLDYCVDSEGNVFVLDHDLTCIKKYDARGQHLITFSRKGEGPGELARPRNLTVTPAGDVIVFDLGNSRFSRFRNDGQYADSHSFQGAVRALRALPDGSVAGIFRFPGENWLQEGMLYKVMWFSDDLQRCVAMDSVYVKDHAVISESKDTLTNVKVPFFGQLCMAVSPAGTILVGHGDNYRISEYSADLRLLNTIGRTTDRVKVSKQDREAYYSTFANPDEQIAVRNMVKLPTYKPYFEAIHVDHEGYVLVETPAVASTEDGTMYDVFDRGGDFVGAVEIPHGTAKRFFGAHIYGLKEPTDDMLPTIIRYRSNE